MKNSREVRRIKSVSPRSLSYLSPYGTRYGLGGRASNSGITATVFGGYGFVGRYLINELGKCGSRVYVPYRGCELEVRHLKPMFDHGQLGLIAFSPRVDESIMQSLAKSDVVVNFIGKNYETKHIVPTRRADGKLSRVNYFFDDVHVKIPAKIAELAKAAGVKTFIHVSASSASPTSNSAWSRSKYAGELAVKEKFPEAIIVRPTTVFGAEDRFLNVIGEALKIYPYFPLLEGGQARIQPVYAPDIGKAIMAMIRRHEEFAGKTFELSGPAEYTYKEAVEFVMDVTTLKTGLLDIPQPIAKLSARLIQELINPILTVDQISRMLEDNVASEDASLLRFKDVGVEATSMDKQAFEYLHRFRPGGHFPLVQGYH